MQNLFTFPLITPRLKLRLHELGDLEDLLAYHSQPEVARYLLKEAWTREEAAMHLESRMQRTGLEKKAGAVALVWEYQGQVIGDAGLWLTDETKQMAEIGWVMNPAFGGQGLATEAVDAVLKLAFDGYGLHRVAAQMDARNTASARLCERLGLQKEAHLRQNWWSKGEWTDTLIYAVLKADRG